MIESAHRVGAINLPPVASARGAGANWGCTGATSLL